VTSKGPVTAATPGPPSAQEPYYPLVVLAWKALSRSMGWRVLVTGEDRIPLTGPGLLASNHVSYLDPVMLGWAVHQRGRWLRFMAKREMFNTPVVGRGMRRMRHVEVDRRGTPGGSVRHAVQRLGEGELVATYPEGTIAPSFVPTEGKSGAARIAMDAGVPLIPVACWGGQRVLTKYEPRNWQRGITLVVRIGEPVDYAPDEDPAEVSERLMGVLAELVEQARLTYPQRPTGPHDLWWVPAHAGGTAPSVGEVAAARREGRAPVRGR
jgi:1-acyl-sn-glycerol-3-phosphate acyltransferase